MAMFATMWQSDLETSMGTEFNPPAPTLPTPPISVPDPGSEATDPLDGIGYEAADPSLQRPHGLDATQSASSRREQR